MNGLLSRFNNEVQNKVELKMVPNKTEEQVLNSFFKFYDLQGSGTCNLQNFIKSLERLGVILPRISDIESIFNYYSNNSGILNYKEFSHLIYDKNNKFNINYNKNNENLKNFDFSEILFNSLIEDGNGIKNLIKLLKSFSIVDYNNMKRISLDEFLKIIKENKININSNQIQFLFQNFEYFANGVVYYKNILKEMMNKNWNINKENVFKTFLNNLNNNNINNLKSIKNYLNNNYLDNYINQYINLFNLDENKSLNEKEIRHLIGFLSFGVDDKELNEILNGENTYSEINKNYNKNYNNNNYLTSQSNYLSSPDSNNYYNNNNNYNDVADINYTVSKIKSNLNKYSRKTLFNFLKHFKYYQSNNNILSSDFEKVLQDFRINLLPNEIKSIFNYFAVDNRKSVVDFNNFLKYLCSLNNNNKREKFIENSFKVLENKSKDLIKILNLEFLKENYNSKNNIFNPDENLNKIDFYDCLELFHNVFKGFKTDKINKNEFFEFYNFIGVLIDNDDDFGRNIYNEWNVEEENKKYFNNLNLNNKLNNNNNNDYNNNNFRNNRIRRNNNNDYEKNIPKPFPQPQKVNFNNNFNNNNNNFNNFNNDYNNFNNNNFQRSNKLNNNFNPLETLKTKLQQRGVRGLLYLHRQFLLSTDISKITFSDFCNVINKEQKLNLSNNELQSIFSNFNNNNYLDFYSFIRNFKKELNEFKLNLVESVYLKLDKNQNENVNLNEILNSYNSNNHPDVLNGKKNAEEKNIEFIDCFELQYELINNDNNNNNNENIVSFEDFANFYEYVAFVYENDKEFENVLLSTWNLI